MHIVYNGVVIIFTFTLISVKLELENGKIING